MVKSNPQINQGWFMPIIICIFFFATAKFYFLDLMGIRKGILYLIITLVFLNAIYRFNYFQKIMFKKNVILFTVYVITLSFVLRSNIQWATMLLTTVILISFILYSSLEIFDSTFKLIIIVLSIFSVLVIIQFLIYILDSSVFNIPYSPDQGYTYNPDHIKIKYPIHYLGWWTSGREHLFGIEIPRFRSLASEPSILVSIFLMPGLLGLTYKGITRKLSYLVLFFSIGLSMAGTIYLAMGFGLFSFLMLFIFSKMNNRVIRSFFIFGILTSIILMFIFILSTNVTSISSLLDNNLTSYSEYSSILVDSGHKSEARLISSKQAYALLIQHPFGFDSKDVLTTSNLLLTYGIEIGFLGVILCGIIFIQIIRNLIYLFFKKSIIFQKIAIALIIGTIIEMIVFSGYGWLAPSGFIMTAILYRRTKNMIQNNSLGKI
jgi:hypothetical protein